MWPWRRRQQHQPVRAEGAPVPDGDTVLFPGQTRRWTDLLGTTLELPTVPWSPANPPATDTTELVRPYMNQGLEEIQRGEFWRRHDTGR